MNRNEKRGLKNFS